MKKSVRSALLDDYSEPVRDMLWGHIYLTPALASIADSPPFTRLHRILQLGPTFRVYPGAAHTRASHSFGVYHLGRRLLNHLAEKGADEWLSFEGVKSFLCACLLHDSGHFPYTHSLKELPLREHESLTGDLIRAEPLKSLVSASGGDPYFAAAIVDTKDPFGGGNSEIRFFRKLLSGALDPDKLDYLSRDGRCCGVPYGAQDVDFILSRLHPHHKRGVDIDSRGVHAVESLLFSKYLMYRAVYWHKSVRAATAMVKKALLCGLESSSIAAEELYNLDDQGLFSLAREHLGRFSSLVEAVSNGRLFITAVEIPFDSNVHAKRLELTRRLQLEESLANEISSVFGKSISGDEIIVDLPEPISFESGLFVADSNCNLSDASNIFKGNSLEAFVSSLRIIRVFVDPRHEAEIKKNHERILHIVEKSLKLCTGGNDGIA